MGMIRCTVSLPWARYFTKSTRPPEALKVSLCAGSSRSSVRVISAPLFRNASSRIRSARVSRLNSRVSTKISGSGQNVTVVPVLVVAFPFFNGDSRVPRA